MRSERLDAAIGSPLERVDTPALVLDLDALERNLDRMAALARAAGKRLRPHAKTHKSPEIARLSSRAGRSGSAARSSARPRCSPRRGSARSW